MRLPEQRKEDVNDMWERVNKVCDPYKVRALKPEYEKWFENKKNIGEKM